MSQDRIRGHLDTLVLSVLRDQPAHGYEIVSELRRRSAGEFDLAEGTLYPALHRLEADGLLTSEQRVPGGRTRRVHRATQAGRKALEEDRRALAEPAREILPPDLLRP